MPVSEPVWALDFGQAALKALKLRAVDDGVELLAYDVIEHAKILSWADADPETLTRNALEKFVEGNPDVAETQVVITVPGATTFARFVTLPPVEPENIPDIIRFEATQQIPFPIEEVVWDYEVLTEPDAPEQRAGIFCIKREEISKILGYYRELKPPLQVELVQAAPLALFNFMQFDGQMGDGTTVLLNIGADTSDLVMSDGKQVVLRNIPLGGNSFTKALVESFKLPYPKAENLKKTAASSKHAKQVFQAMRPVFADFAGELQRTIARYQAQNRESEVTKVVGLGNAFQLPGLQKYLEQHLGIPVVKVEKFNKLKPSPTVQTPKFTQNILSFAVAYGLGVQALGKAKIKSNLVPPEVQADRRWAEKRPWFAAATGLAAAGLALFLMPRIGDLKAFTAENAKSRPEVKALDGDRKRIAAEFADKSGNEPQDNLALESLWSPMEQRDVCRMVYQDVVAAFDTVNAQQLAEWRSSWGSRQEWAARLQAKSITPIPDANGLYVVRYEDSDKPGTTEEKSAGKAERHRAKFVAIRKLEAFYYANVDAAWEDIRRGMRPGVAPATGATASGGAPGFIIMIQGVTTYGCATNPGDVGTAGIDEAQRFIDEQLVTKLASVDVPELRRTYAGKRSGAEWHRKVERVDRPNLMSSAVVAGAGAAGGGGAGAAAAGGGARKSLEQLMEEAGLVLVRGYQNHITTGSPEEVDLRLRWSPVGEYEGDVAFNIRMKVAVKDVVEDLNKRFAEGKPYSPWNVPEARLEEKKKAGP
jgi:type IV pilus assembly protein PilM